MDTEGGGESVTSQSHSRHKKGHMTNIYLKDSDAEAIVDFVKDHEELCNKSNEHDTLRPRPVRNAFGRGSPTVASCVSKCVRLGSNPKRPVMAKSHSPNLVKLQEMAERQNWIQDKFNFMKTHIRCNGLSKFSAWHLR